VSDEKQSDTDPFGRLRIVEFQDFF
jgi:hypothetical protein